MRVLGFAFRAAVLALLFLGGHLIGAVVAGVGTSPRSAAEVPQYDGTAPADPSAKVSSGADAKTPSRDRPDPSESIRLLLLVLVVCVLEALSIAYPIFNARLHGWKLAGAVALLIFGVMTLQAQIEGAVFRVLPIRTSVRLVLMGGLIAMLVAPLAVVVFGRWRRGDIALQESSIAHHTIGSWLGRVAACAVLYAALYLVFGYWIAWQSPEVRTFYGGEASPGFIKHLVTLASNRPGFLALQIGRGILWTMLALLFLTTVRSAGWRSALALGMLFAVLMNAQLLLPNPYMPHAVRMAHILETAPSNFLFGLAAVYALRPFKLSNHRAG